MGLNGCKSGAQSGIGSRGLHVNLLLLGLLLAIAGCGPKGFVAGTVYLEADPLVNQKLTMQVAGRTYELTTSPLGEFRLAGVSLGAHELRASFVDPGTGQAYIQTIPIQVGMQGSGRVELVLEVEHCDPDGLLRAARRQIASGQWAIAREYLEELDGKELSPVEARALDLAWGWFYVQSQVDESAHRLAESHFQAAGQKGSKGEAQVGLAAIAADKGHYQEAVGLLEQALEQNLDPALICPQLDPGDLSIVLATWYLQLGNSERARLLLGQIGPGASARGAALRESILAVLGD